MATVLDVADISHHQGNIAWDKFAPALDGVIMKAGGGDGKRASDGARVLLYEDRRFRRNRDEARRRNLPCWFYFFAGTRNSPRREADHFLSLVADARSDEALALDYEPEHPPADPAGWCVEFIDRVREATGKVCVFYTNEHRVLSHDWRPVVRTGAPLWVAKYGVNDGFPHTPPRTGPWPRATVWQYTSNKRMPGVTENTVDMNQFFGDIAQFRALGSSGLVGASQVDLTEDQFRLIMRSEATEVLDSKARRVKGIVSWERYLQVLLDAIRAPGPT